ncbi:TIR domain-containing protein [Adonisia turfae]|uniref:TIR domain-containing protein n=1 Tax=Adonisia turfae CCMR0081 TaxID=2292702 RepID=A0A6M0RQE6_9CYAN|nr:TIR domain-containing protein [Adonisia turfae]NEZ58488.1 TIR domain-containing protein [Adonisia turfae CCMR0081]
MDFSPTSSDASPDASPDTVQESPRSQYDLFVSYSRRNKAFVQQLVERLRSVGYKLWVDWEEIPLLSQWREEIRQGIVAADNFLYIMSPDSVASAECTNEVDCAIAHNKRLVPILYQTVEPQTVNHKIANVNWVFFPDPDKEPDQFESAFTDLCDSLSKDLDAVRVHTRLLTKTDEWLHHQQDTSLLLRGKNLAFFEQWALSPAQQSSSLTEQQRNYLLASRQAETQQQKQTLRQQRLALMVISSLLLLVGLFATVGEMRRRTAVTREIAALTTASAATLAQGYPLDGLNQAIQAGHRQQQAHWLKQPDLLASVRTAMVTALYQTQEYNRLEGHNDWIYGLAIHPTDGTIVSASRDGDIKYWESSGQLRQTLTDAHGGAAINYVRYSPDGQMMASVGEDSLVRLWTAEGDPLYTLEGHQDFVVGLAFSPDGNALASASDDGTARLWNLANQTSMELTGHQDIVNKMAFSPDGQLLASASDDGTVGLWQSDGKFLKFLAGHGSWVMDVAFSPDGTTLASAGDDGTVHLWQQDGTLITKFVAHDDRINAVAFSPDSRWIATASRDRTVKLWHSQDQTLVRTLRQHRGAIQTFAFTPDSSSLLSAGRDSVVRFWALDLPLTQQYLGHQGDVYSVSLGPGPGQWVSTSADGNLRIWNQEGKSHVLQGEIDTVYHASVSPNGQYIVSGGSDDDTNTGLVELWDSEGQLLRSLGRYGQWVVSVAFDTENQTIAAATDDGTVYLLGLDGTVKHTLAYGDSVFNVGFSPDGQHMTVAGEGGLQIWNTQTYEKVEQIDYPASVYQFDYSPTGDLLAFAASDNKVGLWTVGSGNLQILEGHAGEVYGVEFSPDGQLLASASADKTIRLWQRSGDAIASWSGHQDAVLDVKFFQDGLSLISASYDDALISWDLSVLDLNRAMAVGCDWLQDYLTNHPESEIAQQGICSDG